MTGGGGGGGEGGFLPGEIGGEVSGWVYEREWLDAERNSILASILVVAERQRPVWSAFLLGVESVDSRTFVS